MTKGLSENQAKMLQWLVWLLLVVVAGSNGWLIVDRVEMPDKYVRLERYTEDKKSTGDRYDCDMSRVEEALKLLNKNVHELLTRKEATWTGN